jgi:nitrite reductase (NADH) small subunit
MDYMIETENITESSGAGAPIALDLIPPGQGRCVRVGAARIAIFRQRDGGVFALDARCPHQGGPLHDGLIGAGTVVCPLHGWRFQLADGRGVDNQLAVRCYPVEIREGRVWLQGVERL